MVSPGSSMPIMTDHVPERTTYPTRAERTSVQNCSRDPAVANKPGHRPDSTVVTPHGP
jgi:hypothetical protein